MSGGGGQGLVSRVAALSPEQSEAQGAGYTPVTPNVYQSPFSSIQTASAPTPMPIMGQARQQQPMFNPQLQGIQQLYSMFNRPQMRMPMQMPVYRSPALMYRPDMQSIQQNLRRVAPSVAEQRRIEDEKRAAEEANRPAYTGYEGSNY